MVLICKLNVFLDFQMYLLNQQNKMSVRLFVHSCLDNYTSAREDHWKYPRDKMIIHSLPLYSNKEIASSLLREAKRFITFYYE